MPALPGQNLVTEHGGGTRATPRHGPTSVAWCCLATILAKSTRSLLEDDRGAVCERHGAQHGASPSPSPKIRPHNICSIVWCSLPTTSLSRFRGFMIHLPTAHITRYFATAPPDTRTTETRAKRDFVGIASKWARVYSRPNGRQPCRKIP